MSNSPALSTLWHGIRHGKCPRCQKGSLFKAGVDVNSCCAVCGLLFSREQGYFLGAMYMEYALAAVFLALVTAALHLGGSLPFVWALSIAVLAFLPFIPSTVRLSRTLWIHWDNRVDPQES